MDEAPKPKRPKGFQKGDPNINRNGRPKVIDDLRKLARTIADEVALDAEGKPVIINGHQATVIEVMLRRMVLSTQPRSQQLFLEYTYGKVPDTLNLHEDHEPLTDAERMARIAAIFEQARQRRD